MKNPQSAPENVPSNPPASSVADSLTLSSGLELEESLPELVHQYLRDHISLADQKAGFIFAAVSAVLAYLVSKDDLAALKTFLTGGAALKGSDLVPLLAILSLIASAVLSICVIAPRLGRKTKAGKGFVFWKDICSFPSAEAYSNEMMKLNAAEASIQIQKHCYALARICDQKYARLTWAIWTGVVAFFLTVLSFALSK